MTSLCTLLYGNSWITMMHYFFFTINRFPNIFIILLNQQGHSCDVILVSLCISECGGKGVSEWVIIIITEEEQWCIYSECCSLLTSHDHLPGIWLGLCLVVKGYYWKVYEFAHECKQWNYVYIYFHKIRLYAISRFSLTWWHPVSATESWDM